MTFLDLESCVFIPRPLPRRDLIIKRTKKCFRPTNVSFKFDWRPRLIYGLMLMLACFRSTRDFSPGSLILPRVFWFSHRFSDFTTGSRFSHPLKNPLNTGVLSPKSLFNLETVSNKSSFVDTHGQKPLRFSDVRKFQFWLFSLSSRISWPLITESLYLSDVPKLRLFCNRIQHMKETFLWLPLWLRIYGIFDAISCSRRARIGIVRRLTVLHLLFTCGVDGCALAIHVVMPFHG